MRRSGRAASDPIADITHQCNYPSVDDAGSLNGRRFFAFVTAGGVLIAGSAFFLTLAITDPLGLLFRRVSGSIILVLCGWFFLAWALRRIVCGPIPRNSAPSMLAIVFFGFRMSLLISVLILIGWCLGALAFGAATRATVVMALFSALVFTWITGVMAGAIINSRMVLRRWQSFWAEDR